MSLRDQLQAIYDKHGTLTPALVVEEARDESHPLHPRVFDRPVAEAAEAWYLHRAHELIRSVKVTYKKSDTPGDMASAVRAFHAVRGGDDGDQEYAYKPVDEIVANPLMTELVRREMEREWKSLHRRYSMFVEFVEMVRGDVGGEEAA